MPRRIRVLHIVNNLNYGGMERIVAEMGRRTDPARFESHIMALEYFGHCAQGLHQFATLHLANPMTRWSMLRPASLARDIRRIGPDVVHTHSGSWYKGSLAAQLAGVPAQVYTDHGRQSPDPWVNRTLDGLASRRTNVVVAVSARLAEHMSGFVPDSSKIRVVVNGVDTDLYSPRDAEPQGGLRAQLSIASDRPIIGSVGRLERVKGYEVTLAAFAKLLSTWDRGPRPALVLIGDGRERTSLQSSARQTGFAADVHFLGWRSDIQQCSTAFSIFTMSSHSEGTSVSLLEAMSSGLCPVVTDVGGNSAVLGEALRHRLVPASDPDALASAWHDALTNERRRNQDALAARARVVAHYSLDTMVKQYEDAYQSALSVA